MKSSTRLPDWGSAQIAILIQFAHANRIDTSSLLKGSNLDEESLGSVDPSMAQELKVIENLINVSATHPFKLGLDVGKTNNSNSFGLLGQALTACRSVKEIINIVSDYLSGEHHFIKIRTKVTLNKIITTFDPPSSLPGKTSQFLLGRDFGSAISFQENVLKGLPHMTSEVGFQGSELPGMREIAEHYNCDIKFNQNTNYIYTKLSALDLILPLGNRVLSKILTSKLYTLLNPAHSRDSSLKRQVKGLLEVKNYKNITKEEAAKTLNMSSRTLSRHLKKSGTNWRNYCSQLRMDKAKFLLLESNKSLELISVEIGFSSSSAFSSAFSRIVGKSPMEFRELNRLRFDSNLKELH